MRWWEAVVSLALWASGLLAGVLVGRRLERDRADRVIDTARRLWRELEAGETGEREP